MSGGATKMVVAVVWRSSTTLVNRVEFVGSIWRWWVVVKKKKKHKQLGIWGGVRVGLIFLIRVNLSLYITS